jgi:hypothetical protein
MGKPYFRGSSGEGANNITSKTKYRLYSVRLTSICDIDSGERWNQFRYTGIHGLVISNQ